MTINVALRNAGVENITPEWQDKKQRAGKKYCEWFWGHEKVLSGGARVRWASFGNHSISNKIFHWRSWIEGDEQITNDQNHEAEKLMKETKLKKEKDKNETHERVRQSCDQEFARLPQADTSIYLGRKSISMGFGGKISLAKTPLKPSEIPHLVIPLYDIDQRIWSLQHIYHEGDKTFEKGGKISGLFYLLPTAHHSWFDAHPKEIFIAEGFATACSIQEALGPDRFVVCAFNSGNLRAAGSAIRARYPTTSLVWCADNDCETVVNGKPVNVGFEAAHAAQRELGGHVIWPDLNGAKGDFNDLHCRSFDELHNQLHHQLEAARDSEPQTHEPDSQSSEGARVTKQARELTQLKRRWTDDVPPRLIKPKANEVTDHLLDFYGHRICIQDESIFIYDNTHWRELDKQGESLLYRQIDWVTHHMLGPREIGSYFEYLSKYLPGVPEGVNLFTPNPFVANFQDATLHFRRDLKGSYSLGRRPHNYADYLTHVLPFNCPQDAALTTGDSALLPPAPKFEAWLQTLWAKDKDRDQKIRLFYQVGGMCLLPAFPVISFFIGPPASGKSTLIKLLIKIIGTKNTSCVQPYMWAKQFLMEPMIGKLVNFDTDIDTHKPMDDSMVKKVIDRGEVAINRKNRSIVKAYLPPVHLFAGNSLPKSLDGQSKAYGRRIVIFETSSFRAETGNMTHDYEQLLIDEELEGIVARLIRGAVDLINHKGNFAVPQSSYDLVTEMELNSDPYSQFMLEVKETDIGYKPAGKIERLTLDVNGEVPLKKIFEFFKDWLNENSNGFAKTDYSEKRRLASALRKLNYSCRESNGDTLFKGLCVRDNIFG